VPNYRFNVLNILLVDDSKSMRSLIRVILQAWGITNIYEAENAETAFNRLKEFAIDVILVDIMMKPMNGIEFTKQVRNSEDSADPFVPIIEDILKSDRQVHRKQRHTARRIFERLRDEHTDTSAVRPSSKMPCEPRSSTIAKCFCHCPIRRVKRKSTSDLPMSGLRAN